MPLEMNLAPAIACLRRDMSMMSNYYLLLDKSLDQWHRPEGINVLKSEILGDLAIPVISGIHVLISKCVAIVDAKGLFKFYIGLSLLARCDVCVI
jgi:hypothetical protein